MTGGSESGTATDDNDAEAGTRTDDNAEAGTRTDDNAEAGTRTDDNAEAGVAIDTTDGSGPLDCLVVHGTKGSPAGNWFPWLAAELDERGFGTTVPVFPTPEGQTLGEWLAVAETYVSRFHEGTVVVGHSLGAAFLLRLLERGVTARRAVLVSGFTGAIGHEEFDDLNADIAGGTIDFTAIRRNCGAFRLFHGDDDPYVALSKAETLADRLDGELTVVDGGGHLNERFGYTELPAVRDDVLEALE